MKLSKYLISEYILINHMKKIFIIPLICLLFISCSEDSSFFDPTYFGDGFKGITFTGESDPTSFKSDPSDWCSYYPANLPGSGENTNVNENNSILPMGLSFGPAYPNPVTMRGSFSIPFNLPTTSHVYIYIINNDYRIVKVVVNKEKSAGVYIVHVSSDDIGPAGVYRVVLETDNIYCTGDVWIKGSEDYY